MMDNTYYIGIDIAKSKFDIAFISDGAKTHKVFNNTTAGIQIASYAKCQMQRGNH